MIKNKSRDISPKRNFFNSVYYGRFSAKNIAALNTYMRQFCARTYTYGPDAAYLIDYVFSCPINVSRMGALQWTSATRMNAIYYVRTKKFIVKVYMEALRLVERRRLQNIRYLTKKDRVRIVRKWFESSAPYFITYEDMIRRFCIAFISLGITIFDIFELAGDFLEFGESKSYENLRLLASDAFERTDGLFEYTVFGPDTMLLFLDKEGGFDDGY